MSSLSDPPSAKQRQWEQRCERFVSKLNAPKSYARLEAEKMKALTLLGWIPQPQPQKQQTRSSDEVWMLTARLAEQKQAATQLSQDFLALHQDELAALTHAKLAADAIAPGWESRRDRAMQSLEKARDQGLSLPDALRACLGSACQVSELAFWSLGWRVKGSFEDSVVDFFGWKLGNLTRPLPEPVGRRMELSAMACWDAVDAVSYYGWGSERWPSHQNIDGHFAVLRLFGLCQRSDWSAAAPADPFFAASQAAWTLDEATFDAFWANPWVRRAAAADSPWKAPFHLSVLNTLASRRGPSSAAWQQKMRWGVEHGLKIDTLSSGGDNLLHLMLLPTAETGSEGYYIDPQPAEVLWILREWPQVDWNAKNKRGMTPIDFALRCLNEYRRPEALTIQSALLASQEERALQQLLTPSAGAASSQASSGTPSGESESASHSSAIPRVTRRI